MKDSDGWTPLHHACFNGNLGLCLCVSTLVLCDNLGGVNSLATLTKQRLVRAPRNSGVVRELLDGGANLLVQGVGKEAEPRTAS